ncbi:SigB/SigF/SigG family RNA polymerase sigma factor [Halonatronum saccharophilum]|uniref:SigB/SigF/SigG family RNA polymerase sigma factor n=1 Tax=Halonatronum saccharophilum TaxID=150060 RepID=UPI000487BDD6|nr:SigB/SigF/SigG family RNA polymerase sigma factor [Halonatronum saccharophilum]
MEKVKVSGLNTGDIPLLSDKEMLDLFNAMDRGKDDARDKLVNSNLRLVLSILKRFKRSDHPIDDLFQVGCIGLMKAVDNFDINRGLKFSTYAVPMIIGEIKRYIRDNRKIRVSRSLRKLAYQVLKLKEQLRQKNGKEPTISEIAEKLEISKEEIIYALDATKTPISLFKPVFQGEGEDLYLVDQLSIEDKVDWTEHINMKEAFNRLEPRELMIIKLKFYEGATQSEIAQRIGLSQAQISRIQKKALKKLKGEMELREAVR